MLLKASLVFLLISISRAIELSKDEISPYFESYINRKFTLLKTEHSVRPNSLCFQTKFRVGNLDQSHFAFGSQTEEEEKIAHEWFYKNIDKRHPKKITTTMKCSSPHIAFFLNYKFPEGYEDGAEMDDIDVKMLVEKRLFYLGLPETCNDVATFIRIFARYNKMEEFTTKVEELEDATYKITNQECYPMVKMSEFMKTFSMDKVDEDFEREDKNLRYYTSTDSQKDYMKWYLDRKSVLLKPKENAVDQSMCFRSKFPIQRPKYMNYVFGAYSTEQNDREMKWFDEKLREKKPVTFDSNHNCTETPVQYTLNYELPIGAENGTAELDALDVKIMKHRELYLKNLPISCDNMKLFIKTFVDVPVQRFIRQLELRRDKNDYLVTLDTCYHIVDLNKIVFDNIDPDDLEFPAPKKHQPNKWLLDDYEFMKKFSKVEAQLREELRIKELEKKLGKKLKKIEL